MVDSVFEATKAGRTASTAKQEFIFFPLIEEAVSGFFPEVDNINDDIDLSMERILEPKGVEHLRSIMHQKNTGTWPSVRE